MKPLKAVVVVAGSMVVAGVAAPAFATDFTPPTSLNGGLDTAITRVTHEPVDAMPLRTQSRALDTENQDSALRTVKGATKAMNSASGPTGLLGGAPPKK